MTVESLTQDWQALQNAVSALTSPERGSASMIAFLSSSFLTRLIPMLAASKTDCSATDALSSSGSVDAFSFSFVGLPHNPLSISPPRRPTDMHSPLSQIDALAALAVLDPELHDEPELRVQVHPLAARLAVYAVGFDLARVRIVLEELATLRLALARAVPPSPERPPSGRFLIVLQCIRASFAVESSGYEEWCDRNE